MVSCNWCTHSRPAEPRAEIEEDVGGLRDDELAGLEKRRRKRRARDAPPIDQLHHGGNAALASPARHVDIVGACLLQGEADEFAATLDRRPVVELVAHEDYSRVAGATRPRSPQCWSAEIGRASCRERV